MKKTVLITGAAGFIGSHICDFFTLKNYNVIGLDNLSTGKLPNLSNVINDKSFKFYEIDITKSFKIDDKIDYILHFASPASPKDYLKMPLETMRVGSIGTENILKIALKNKATILIASTSEIYGNPNEHPQKEEYFGNVNPIGPRAVYDEAKRFQEAMTMAYHRYFGLNIRIARIFNTYGNRMRLDDGRALPTFMSQAISGKNLTIFGNGNQSRCFCHIDDMVDGITKLLFSNYNKPINLGNPDEITINDFAYEIKDVCNSESKLTYEEIPEDDPVVRKPDITKAIKILNWNPKISREIGLKKTLKYFKDLILLS